MVDTDDDGYLATTGGVVLTYFFPSLFGVCSTPLPKPQPQSVSLRSVISHHIIRNRPLYKLELKVMLML